MADLAKLVEEISALTLLEAAELVKALENKLGVSAAAPVAERMPARDLASYRADMCQPPLSSTCRACEPSVAPIGLLDRTAVWLLHHPSRPPSKLPMTTPAAEDTKLSERTRDAKRDAVRRMTHSSNQDAAKTFTQLQYCAQTRQVHTMARA